MVARIVPKNKTLLAPCSRQIVLRTFDRIWHDGCMSYPHREDCRCGKDKLPLAKGDAWWVDAPEYGNCFWTYLRYNDRQHTLSEIAKRMKLSISAITSIERKAFTKLRRRLELLDSAEK